MSDRSLLEDAAKAAGIQLADEIDSSIPSGGLWVVGKSGRDAVWDPLRDDGDALRLAVKLKIPLQFPDFQDIARTWGAKSDTSEYIEAALNHNGDLAAAVRRAITRAAAAISSQNRGVE